MREEPMQGIIVKGIAGFYYVLSGGEVYQCKARGKFKNQHILPTVGDQVMMEKREDGDSVIIEILPRKNSFIRPPIANVDCLVVVIAAAEPEPNLTLLDRFLAMAEYHQTQAILCVNKMDLVTEETRQKLYEIYGNLYPLVFVCGLTGNGLGELQQMVAGKRCAFAGPSGVGKSTILGRILPSEQIETGEISEKTKRGKHTTRHVEIFRAGENTLLYDTPGFTSFEVLEAEEDELSQCYPEMLPLMNQCRYDNCRHLNEPGCAVIEAVEEGRIHPSRYRSYSGQLQEIRQKPRYQKGKKS